MDITLIGVILTAIVGLINVVISIANHQQLKKIEVYKANFDRTNRKINYIQQAIQDLHLKDDPLLNNIFTDMKEEKITIARFHLDQTRRLQLIKGVVFGVIPFLSKDNKAKVENILSEYVTDVEGLDNEFTNPENHIESDDYITDTMCGFIKLTSEITIVLQEQIGELLLAENENNKQ
jgi:hypothetical protein